MTFFCTAKTMSRFSTFFKRFLSFSILFLQHLYIHSLCFWFYSIYLVFFLYFFFFPLDIFFLIFKKSFHNHYFNNLPHGKIYTLGSRFNICSNIFPGARKVSRKSACVQQTNIPTEELNILISPQTNLLL